MTESSLDATSDRGVYHLRGVTLTVGPQKPILVFYDRQSRVPQPLRSDKATTTWIDCQAIHSDYMPDVSSVNTARQPPVLLVLPQSNPAHALNDCIFSIALENLDPPSGGKFSFDHFFLARSQPAGTDYAEKSWGYYVLQQLGLVDPQGELAADMTRANQSFFFHHLVMPKYMRHRFAADWSAIGPQPGAAYVDQSEGLYPSRVLQHMQLILFRNCFSKPVTARAPGHFARKLLVYDRGDASRRKWANAGEAVRLIKKEFGRQFSEINHLSHDYGTLKPEQQARLFNESDVILAPHGGALANLLFCRPGTYVIEFSDASRPFGWFHFCRRLGMTHIIHSPLSLDHHYADTFTVPVGEIRSLMKAWASWNAGRVNGV